ncbi:MAG: Crp/Fnr family transcriptional regulator [Methyloceanibacter sp.]
MPPLDRSLIKALPPFCAMDEGALDAVIAQATSQRIPQGEAVFRQGEIAQSFFVLLHGRLKVIKVAADGSQFVVRFVNPGDLYGIAKALRRPDYPATALALVDSVTLIWPNAIWDDLVAEHPAFAGNVMQAMGQRLEEAHTRLKELSSDEVAARVAHTLLRLVKQSGREAQEGVVFDFPVTQQDIAEASGTTLHSVSRVFGAWEKAGLVTTGRRKIVVHDVGGLAALAGRSPGGA